MTDQREERADAERPDETQDRQRMDGTTEADQVQHVGQEASQEGSTGAHGKVIPPRKPKPAEVDVRRERARHVVLRSVARTGWWFPGE